MSEEEHRRNSELTKFEWGMLQEWIEKTGKSTDQHFFTVRVGEGADTEAIKERWLKKLIKHNTKYKIDCLKVNEKKEVTIVEVKPVADLGAIGQLICYQYLYNKEFEILPKMILLCLYANDTILQLCDYFKIEVIQQSEML